VPCVQLAFEERDQVGLYQQDSMLAAHHKNQHDEIDVETRKCPVHLHSPNILIETEQVAHMDP
jgi:hypothetical protein